MERGTDGRSHRGHDTTMTTNIKLYGSKSRRFQTIKDELEAKLGYQPSNTEVVGILMAEYQTDEQLLATPR
jgi:hypothetical protein